METNRPHPMRSTTAGRAGEDQAITFLRNKGMHIVDRNVQSDRGEVDVVAIDGDTLVFVEVKAWAAVGFSELRYAVNRRKQRRIIETAKYFLATHREYTSMTVRFDVVFIEGSAFPENTIIHLESAFMECI